MRLIEFLKEEKDVFCFSALLTREGIVNFYEKKGESRYNIWIQEEDDFDKALAWKERFLTDPHDPVFQVQERPIPSVSAPIASFEEPPKQSSKKISRFFTPTYWIILICGILFLWSDLEETQLLQQQGPIGVQLLMIPLQQVLLFDYPEEALCVQKVLSQQPLKDYQKKEQLPKELIEQLESAQELPVWKGLVLFLKTGKQGVLFEKIRQGEVWRLFTPCLLHSDFLHILFNMTWVWILVRQLETRLKYWKLAVLILILGIVSNMAQYVMSGPYFVGFSGVVVGLAAFIWVRQTKAPWEGYPLSRSTNLFLLFFILAMVALEIISWILQALSVVDMPLRIANTAHVIGGLTGLLCGQFSFFARRSL